MFVYLITNMVDEKYYVGKTGRTLGQRWSSHKHQAEKGYRGITRLHRAMREVGTKNFSVTVLSEVHDSVTLDQLEILWILTLRSFDPTVGYNNKMGGGGRRVGNWLEEFKKAHQRKKRQSPVTPRRPPVFRKDRTGENNPNYGGGLFGHNNPMFGKPRPDLAEWNRVNLKGKKRTPLSKETKDRISQSKRDWWARRKQATCPV